MTKFTFITALALSSTLAIAHEVTEFDLEACINGAVSAKGGFAEQSLEDLANALNALQQDEYALEPCINGGVSASGLFVSQAAEDAVRALMASQH
jgi:hypothetical protein